jgi:magnesium transporter
MPPGSLVYTGDKAQTTKIDLVRYDEEHFRHFKNITLKQAIENIGENTSNWVIISGFSDTDSLEGLGEHFGITPLILEDIFNVQHLPKVEDTGNSLFITLKSLSFEDAQLNIEAEQISLYLNDNVLITFQEQESHLFDAIIERLETGKGKARTRQEDFLAYLLIDHIVDNYYLLLDRLEDQVEVMEHMLMESPSDELAFKFMDFKKSLSLMRRTIYPLKDEIRYISREETEIIREITRQHLSDVHDHLSHIIQSLDSYREMISAMMDLLLANYSNRMNSIMKTLTLVSTIFIPLTFAAGIYGMNFKYMPELEWHYGYPVFLLIVLGIGLGMYFYMKRKKWF